MRFIKTLRNIWGLLLFPILVAIWWLSRYGTGAQQNAFMDIVYLYWLGAIIQVLIYAAAWINQTFQNRRKDSGEN